MPDAELVRMIRGAYVLARDFNLTTDKAAEYIAKAVQPLLDEAVLAERRRWIDYVADLERRDLG